jgi:UDP-GlcNAc:undecaprenyl-phosphate GlcNAc-1-phosphate transferase
MLSVAQVTTTMPVSTWDTVLSPHIYVFYAAFIVSFLFTPIMRLVANYYGIIDQPDHLRKLHTAPVAYLGGVAVFIGWVAGLATSQIHIPQDEIG